MIKEALQYIVGLKEPVIQEINGDVYSDKPLNRIDTYYPKATALCMSNLSSLIAYLKSAPDDLPDKMIIQVVSPAEVRLYSGLDDLRDRENLVVVNAQIPRFDYERFIDHEAFCIAVQAKFVNDPDTDKALLLKFAGTVESGTVAQYGDDGVSQKATVKTGIASKADAVVPNPVTLRPFRTFPEVTQPVSSFIFRMKESGGISCALFEADGGAWKNEAMNNIRDYLEKTLHDTLAPEDFERITFIS